jgi:hypothetical protein
MPYGLSTTRDWAKVEELMTKALLIAAIFIVILLLGILMWPSAAPRGPKDAAQGDEQKLSALVHADPYDNSTDFYAEWQNYLRGGSTNVARITSTAALHHEWINSIFSNNRTDMNDGLRLALGKYRILYPYMSGEMIDNYGILLIEVSNNKPEIVCTLLKCGANPNKELILTAATSPYMIDLLIRAGADPNKPRRDGSSPREYFEQLGRPDLVDAMIRNGAR